MRAKKHRARPYLARKPGPFPLEGTELSMPFQVAGTYYPSPIYYRTKSKKESKAYITLFNCSVCRAVHLELAENLTSKEFMKCFKRSIAKRSKSKIIYSESLKTFKIVEAGYKR